MIILTTPRIDSYVKPSRMSSSIAYLNTNYILAEVDDDFDLNEDQMDTHQILFWYPLCESQIDPTEYRSSKKWAGGMIQAAIEDFNLSNERNIAYIIHSAANHRGLTVWELWEKAIDKSLYKNEAK